MAFILSDRVKETTTTTGTGSVVLGGTIDASTTFSAAIGNGNSTYYCIESPDGNYEVGIGTYTSASNSLSRDTVISSSNSGSKISLVGVSNVFCTQPGPKAVFINSTGLVSGVDTSFEGFAFPDGTIQYTSATSGNAPITIERQNSGVFFNYFINNAYDETVSLHLEDEQYPRFKLGLRDTAEGNSAPTYGYLFGEQGYAGGVGDSTCEFYVANNNGFWIKHNSQNIANFAQDDGIIFQNVAAASPTFTVKGNAAQAADLQRWNDSSSTTLAKVTKEGHVSGVELHTPTISFADGTTQTTAGYTGTGDINVNQYIYHEGDSNTYIRFRGDQIDFVAGNVTMLTLDEASNDKVIINNGQNNVDFQVEGDGDANLIRTDAANDRVGIGTDSPSYLLDVAGSGSFEGIRFSDGTTQATSFAADVATASGALRADITTNTAAIPASGYAISGALQSQIDGLGGASISYVDAATSSGVANSGFLSEELHEISGVGGLIANKSNWDTAYGWGDHSSAGYLTSQTSHADVVVDGDFSSQGLMKRGFTGGSYSIVTDNSSNWNTAYSWGNHSTQGYTNLSLVSGIVANSGYAISGALQSQIDGISGGSDSFTSESGVAHSGFFSEELHEVSGVGGLITSIVANSGYHISGVLQPQITTNTTAIPASGYHISGVLQPQISSNTSNISTNTTAIPASGYHISGVLQPQITTNTTAIPASGYHISGVLQPQITTNAAAIPASGYHISGILQTQITNLNHDTLTGFVANEHIDWTADQGSTNIHTGNYDNTTYTAGSGIELQGTEFNVAISGDNILATNTPTNNYVPSYVNGQITWVANTGGGGGGGSVTTVKANGSQVGGADIVTLDFSSDFTVAETPDTEINISITKGISDGNFLTANNAVADDDFLRINGTEVEGLTAAEVRTALNVEDGADVTDATNVTAAGALMDSELTDLAGVKGVTISTLQVKPSEGAFADGDKTKLDGIEASADVTDATNVTAAGALMDSEVTNLAFVKGLTKGISDGNVLTANDAVADDDFLRINGTEVEGLTAAEVRTALNVADGATANAGDITSVVAGDGLTGGATTGDATLNVVGGDGITANANDVAITAAQTTITSVYNASLKMGRDSENLIDFATTDNKIILRANNVDQVSLIDNVFGPEADSDVDLGTTSKRWKDAYVDSLTTTDKITIGGSINQAPATSTDGGAIDINCGDSNYHEITLNANASSIVFTNVTAGQKVIVRFKQHSSHVDLDSNDGFDTVTVNGSAATVTWPGGTIPTLTETNNAVDVYGFLFQNDETKVHAFIIGQNLS